MIPFVERKLQSCRTGSSRDGQESPVPTGVALRPLDFGGKATVARMFVNMASGQRGLVCQYDVVLF